MEPCWETGTGAPAGSVAQGLGPWHIGTAWKTTKTRYSFHRQQATGPEIGTTASKVDSISATMPSAIVIASLREACHCSRREVQAIGCRLPFRPEVGALMRSTACWSTRRASCMSSPFMVDNRSGDEIRPEAYMYLHTPSSSLTPLTGWCWAILDTVEDVKGSRWLCPNHATRDEARQGLMNGVKHHVVKKRIPCRNKLHVHCQGGAAKPSGDPPLCDPYWQIGRSTLMHQVARYLA